MSFGTTYTSKPARASGFSMSFQMYTCVMLMLPLVVHGQSKFKFLIIVDEGFLDSFCVHVFGSPSNPPRSG
eukprot:1542036-Rhodomonas_salina.1